MKHSIVVVEDDKANLTLIQNTLENPKYCIEGFEDGEHAWQYLEQNAQITDVVILAKTIPNINGMQLLQKMQEHKTLELVPVIIQTLDTEQGKYQQAIEQGAHFYITKPLDPKKLATLVRAAIRTKGKQNKPPQTFAQMIENERNDLSST